MNDITVAVNTNMSAEVSGDKTTVIKIDDEIFVNLLNDPEVFINLIEDPEIFVSITGGQGDVVFEVDGLEITLGSSLEVEACGGFPYTFPITFC